MDSNSPYFRAEVRDDGDQWASQYEFGGSAADIIDMLSILSIHAIDTIITGIDDEDLDEGENPLETIPAAMVKHLIQKVHFYYSTPTGLFPDFEE